ncbi:MAG: sulfatase-like hydrolase/transferase [Planctomycetes bacterium]|nr:sulfatase-like hydrolase/transferase [Planctomycetota bacterium]
MTTMNEVTRREFVRTVGSAAAAGLLLAGGRGARASAPAAPKRPNVVLCMTDDQGWGDVGYNGHRDLRTPTLDAMAGSGIRFDRFYAAAPVCSPTRGSCLTGRHPDRYGCFSWGFDLPLEEITLAEALKGAGYATGHFGKWHLGGIPTVPGREDRTNRGRRPIEKGREPHPGNQGFDEWFSFWNFFDLDPPSFYHNGLAVGPLEGEASEIVVERALRWIRETVGRKRPFLAVVWFGNPHLPHQALEKDRAPYRHLSERLQHYLGEITAIDRAMGRLRDGLRALGVDRDTMLWFTSDNGATAIGSNGGLRGHKATLWEGGVRVPGILEWPARIAKPFATDVPASTMDYYPTLIDLLGIRVPKPVSPVDGISLAPLIDGRMTDRPAPIPFEVRGLDGKIQWAALTGKRYKLHRRRVAGGRFALSLYDLRADPVEEIDIAAKEPDIVADTAKRLEAWQASVERSLAGGDYAPA